MCEESACLVPPLVTNQNGTAQNRRMLLQLPRFCMPTTLSVPVNNNGASNHGQALVGFHEDALSQAAMGKAQILLTIVLGLALAADCSEVTLLEFILPAAELHLCMTDERKGWLISITLLAMATGSFAWGILADHLGRRRALISALAVAVLFSAVAAVMPTYGTFMTARFCSGLGVSGAFPIAFSYLAETCSRYTRARYLGFLHSFWPLGGILTSIISHFTMPTHGADIVLDIREHWSSWHRFLIISILPTIACIIGLLWASESPRYLLEDSREVEALAVYQRLHRLNKAATQYGLTELELPGRNAYRDRPTSPPTNILNHGLDSFREAFQRVSSPTYFRTTLQLATLHFIIGFLYMGITTFAIALGSKLRDEQYALEKQYVNHENYTGIVVNTTLENIDYKYTTFKNATFLNVNLNHVDFVNCTIEDSEFINVKSSVSFFTDTTIRYSKFIDTDLTDYHFINCNMINNTFLTIISGCTLDFDYNNYLEDVFSITLSWAGFMIVSILVVGYASETVSRPLLTLTTLICFGFATIGMLIPLDISMIGVVEVVMKMTLMATVNTITLVVVEAYPCHLRCTAHGMMRCLFHLASLCAIPIYIMLVNTMAVLTGVLTLSLTVCAALLSAKIQNNSRVLL